MAINTFKKLLLSPFEVLQPSNLSYFLKEWKYYSKIQQENYIANPENQYSKLSIDDSNDKVLETALNKIIETPIGEQLLQTILQNKKCKRLIINYSEK